MTTTEQDVNAAIDRLAVTVMRIKCERDESLDALRRLYDACPTGYGNDTGLDEALKRAEVVLAKAEGRQ